MTGLSGAQRSVPGPTFPHGVSSLRRRVPLLSGGDGARTVKNVFTMASRQCNVILGSVLSAITIIYHSVYISR